MPAPTVAALTEQLTTAPTLDDLREALRTAIWIEFATIPPYLTAFWSIIDPDADEAADAVASLYEIWREEMLHLGLVANMLKAVGGIPEFNSPGSIPTYPGPLPGGVHPELTVELRGLSPEVVGQFMRIEYPDAGPVALTPNEIATAAVLGGPLGLGVPALSTIGAFYAAIVKAFDKLNPPLDPAGQVLEPMVGVTKITTREEFLAAVELITHQGEGSATSPEDTDPTDLAHYYRFAELRAGRRLVKDAAGVYGYTGAEVKLPPAWPVGPVPSAGYPEAAVDPDVWPQVAIFDGLFRTMVEKLQAAWDTGNQPPPGGGPKPLTAAIQAMKKMKVPARMLMEKPLLDGSGRHPGPAFRLI